MIVAEIRAIAISHPRVRQWSSAAIRSVAGATRHTTIAATRTSVSEKDISMAAAAASG